MLGARDAHDLVVEIRIDLIDGAAVPGAGDDHSNLLGGKLHDHVVAGDADHVRAQEALVHELLEHLIRLGPAVHKLLFAGEHLRGEVRVLAQGLGAEQRGDEVDGRVLAVVQQRHIAVVLQGLADGEELVPGLRLLGDAAGCEDVLVVEQAADPAVDRGAVGIHGLDGVRNGAVLHVALAGEIHAVAADGQRLTVLKRHVEDVRRGAGVQQRGELLDVVRDGRRIGVVDGDVRVLGLEALDDRGA